MLDFLPRQLLSSAKMLGRYLVRIVLKIYERTIVVCSVAVAAYTAGTYRIKSGRSA